MFNRYFISWNNCWLDYYQNNTIYWTADFKLAYSSGNYEKMSKHLMAIEKLPFYIITNSDCHEIDSGVISETLH